MRAAVALVLPAGFHHVGGPAVLRDEDHLSVALAVVLLATYALGLVFTLRTHRPLFSGERTADAAPAQGGWSVGKAVGVLAVATAGVVWMSEVLVGSVEHAAKAVGMTDLFVGVVVVAVIGNAAEHSTAVMLARDDRMDLAVSIAIGSSIQIALFVAPVLVLLSYLVAPEPMDLVFSGVEVLAVLVAVVLCGQVASDGESHWLEGAQLLAVYLMLALLFFFLPASAGHVSPPPGVAPPPEVVPIATPAALR
jgi:Ca2+:H+ antiporter